MNDLFIGALAYVQNTVALLPLLVIGVILYIEFHTRGINSRINATIKLFNLQDNSIPAEGKDNDDHPPVDVNSNLS